MLVTNPTGKSFLHALKLFKNQSQQFLTNCVLFIFRAKPYSNFKPGQTTLDRDYYAAATQEKASGDKCLGNFQRFGSDYNKGVSGAVKPGDYVVPSKDANNLSKSQIISQP